MKVLNVLYQTDNNYAVLAGVSMTGLFRNNTHLDEINIYMLDNGISEENLKRYKTLCDSYGRNLTVIDTTKYLERIKSYGLGTFREVYTVYLTMFVVKDLEINTDRVFKLDADTIVMGPLDELCDFDFKGNYLAATYDCILNSYKPLVGLTPDDSYFNAGILLINKEAWISNNCEQQLIDHVHMVRSKYLLCEQDLMNIVFRGHISYMPVKYNLNSGFYIFGAEYSYKLYRLNRYAFSDMEEVKDAMAHPLIHHLMGAMTGRPWEKGNTHPLRELFMKELSDSLWSDYELREQKRSPVFTVQKFLFSILQDWAYMRIHRWMNLRYDRNIDHECIKTASVYHPEYLITKYYGSEYIVKKPLNILYQANDYYAPYLGVSLLSLLDRNRHIAEINIFVIDDGISDNNKEKITGVVSGYGRRISYIPVERTQKMLEEAGVPKFRGNYATYYKLFILDELPEYVEQILYVDSDTVVRGALDEMTDYDFGGKSLAMVPAIYHDKYREKVGISYEDWTYNAGIMAFNIPLWKKNRCRQRLIDGMHEDPQVLTFAPDQSLAIKVLQKDLAMLPLKYNFSTLYTLFSYKEITSMFSNHEAALFTQEDIDDAYKNIVIYHFIELQVGKPWEADSVHPKKYLWKEYFDKSPWSDLPAPKVKLSFILKAQRLAYKILPTKLYMKAYDFAWKHLNI